MQYTQGQYGYDLERLQEHVTTVELVAGDSRVVLVPEFQGRIMTSTTEGHAGHSYGWINHELIASEHRSPAFNAFGGEERFWLGPEGGQFSLYFKKGDPMVISNWKVPASLDTEKWELREVTPEMATFFNAFSLKNYSGTEFQLEVTRRVGIIFPDEIQDILHLEQMPPVRSVAYESLNEVKNTGTISWNKKTGLLSVWMLSMYNPSPAVTIVVPFAKECEGPVLKADYFGEIPVDRLVTGEKAVFLKADGRYRSKIGIKPGRALPVLGSYDARNKNLTILETSIDPVALDYVNSSWDPWQTEPYRGDIINAYNDGPLENGSQLGPFYELESSSPALALEPGEARFHLQRTYHFEGAEADLNSISEKVLGISIEQIKNAFKPLNEQAADEK